MAEREGFEPPDPCESTVFKTAALDRSATSPDKSASDPRTFGLRRVAKAAQNTRKRQVNPVDTRVYHPHNRG